MKFLSKLSTRFAMRNLAAVILAVAMLAAIAPLSVSSHAQSCNMPCCAGGSCSTGACDVSFGKQIKRDVVESHCEHNNKSLKHEATALHLHPALKSPELCGSANLTRLFGSSRKQNVQPDQTRVEAGSLSKPCSSDCCTGTVTTSQIRRSREVAISNKANKPHAPPLSRLSHFTSNPAFLNARLRRLSPPRAPPGPLNQA